MDCAIKTKVELIPQDILYLIKSTIIFFVILIIFEMFKNYCLLRFDLIVVSSISVFFYTILFVWLLTSNFQKYRDFETNIQKEYVDSFHKYQSLISNIPPIGIFKTSSDPEGRFLGGNETVISMFDLDGRDINTVKIKNIYKDPQKRDEIREKLTNYGFIKNEEIEFKSLKNRIFWGLVSIITKKSPDGKISFEGHITDITDIKKAQQNLAAANSELERINRLTVERENEMVNLKKEINNLRTYADKISQK